MKKLVAISLAVMLVVLSLTGCGSQNASGDQNANGDEKAGEGHEIALITDKGNIDDKSFNQGSWEGVVAFAEKNKSHILILSLRMIQMMDT